MKRMIMFIVMLLIVGFGGYFYYQQQAKPKAPDKVATDTGTQEIQSADLAEYSKQAQEYEKKFKFNDVFDSWDALNDAEGDDDSYTLDKYPDKKLFLEYAAKQEDGKIVAVFSDKKPESTQNTEDK